MNMDLLEFLVCPKTGGALFYVEATSELWSREGAIAYPVRDGIPIMLVEESRKLSDSELQKIS